MAEGTVPVAWRPEGSPVGGGARLLMAPIASIGAVAHRAARPVQRRTQAVAPTAPELVVARGGLPLMTGRTALFLVALLASGPAHAPDGKPRLIAMDAFPAAAEMVPGGFLAPEQLVAGRALAAHGSLAMALEAARLAALDAQFRARFGAGRGMAALAGDLGRRVLAMVEPDLPRIWIPAQLPTRRPIDQEGRDAPLEGLLLVELSMAQEAGFLARREARRRRLVRAGMAIPALHALSVRVDVGAVGKGRSPGAAPQEETTRRKQQGQRKERGAGTGPSPTPTPT